MDPARSGLNYYAYCKANPLRFTDPYGLCPSNGYTADEWMQILEAGVVGLDVEGYTTDDRLLNIANHIFGYDNLINFWSTGDYSQLAEGSINLASMFPGGYILKDGKYVSKIFKASNKLAKKQVDAVACEYGIKGIKRKEFGKYIEKSKKKVQRRGDDNFTYEELREIAEEFLNL